MTRNIMAGSYDFEEQERLAELKAWWEDNRVFVFGIAIAGFVGLAGWEGYKAWKERRLEDAAMMYRPVAAAARDNDAKKVGEAGKVLIDKHPSSFYASEAALMMAKNAFDAGRRSTRKRLRPSTATRKRRSSLPRPTCAATSCWPRAASTRRAPPTSSPPRRPRRATR
jgi:predicted negative regulator of RcsB-dependent stress response